MTSTQEMITSVQDQIAAAVAEHERAQTEWEQAARRGEDCTALEDAMDNATRSQKRLSLRLEALHEQLAEEQQQAKAERLAAACEVIAERTKGFAPKRDKLEKARQKYLAEVAALTTEANEIRTLTSQAKELGPLPAELMEDITGTFLVPMASVFDRNAPELGSCASHADRLNESVKRAYLVAIG